MRKFSGGKALAVAAVVGGAVLASVAPVMADVAAQSPSTAAVRVESPAKIKALGAVAEVKVTYACQSGAQAYLNLNVTQSVLRQHRAGQCLQGEPQLHRWVRDHHAQRDGERQGVRLGQGVREG